MHRRQAVLHLVRVFAPVPGAVRAVWRPSLHSAWGFAPVAGARRARICLFRPRFRRKPPHEVHSRLEDHRIRPRTECKPPDRAPGPGRAAWRPEWPRQPAGWTGLRRGIAGDLSQTNIVVADRLRKGVRGLRVGQQQLQGLESCASTGGARAVAGVAHGCLGLGGLCASTDGGRRQDRAQVDQNLRPDRVRSTRPGSLWMVRVLFLVGREGRAATQGCIPAAKSSQANRVSATLRVQASPAIDDRQSAVPRQQTRKSLGPRGVTPFAETAGSARRRTTSPHAGLYSSRARRRGHPQRMALIHDLVE